MQKLLSCFILFAALFLATQTTFAKDNYENVSDGQVNEALNNLPHVRFLPPNPLYYLIRSKELFNRFFTASSVDRARFDFMVSGKRLREMHDLAEKNDGRNFMDLIESYQISTERSIKQLEKARTQNQEIAPIVDEIISDLNYHEVLLLNMNNRNIAGIDKVIENFKVYVNSIEKFKAGTKNKFKITKENNLENLGKEHLPSPIPTSSFETTASPKRIIY